MAQVAIDYKGKQIRATYSVTGKMLIVESDLGTKSVYLSRDAISLALVRTVLRELAREGESEN